ncbi:hypothetical protein QBC41DRAFT_385833, partial [Cercophora samala]
MSFKMFANAILLCSTLLLTSFGIAHAGHPQSNYTMIDLQWDLPILPGNASAGAISVNGTIEKAVEQMEQLYPGWNQTFHSHLQTLSPANSKASQQKEEPTGWDCDIDEKPAQEWCVLTGIKYLRGVSGIPKNGPGPNECGRVSCSYHCGIHWCNDNTFEKEVTWDGIADGAQELIGKCGTRDRWVKVKGRMYYKNNWNVLVKLDDC